MNTRTPFIEIPESVILPPSLLQKMIEHAEAALPNECCGVLGGRGKVITAVYPVENDLAAPDRFQANPRDLFDSVRKIRTCNEEMLGIYHSHPNGPAEPSPTDRDENYYPGLFYFIISLQNPRADARCYVMTEEGEFLPVRLV